MAIIRVSHVTKDYRLGEMASVTHSLQWLRARIKNQPVPERPLFRALDDVDFEVKKGEVVGVVGVNGAGKSTLLKLLAGITSPTKGSIAVNGAVAPLIEVSAGMINALTGRENIFLNGAILGIPRNVIREKIDEIVDFAELEEFINTPIKRYSYGMRVRLGFSIATAVDPDILIVDEVLAVGDLAFQRKCFDRLEDLIRRRGRTVLIVSHNIRQIERLCTRVMLLDRGKIVADGEPHDVCDLFYQRSNEKVYDDARKAHMARAQVRSSGEAKLLNVEVLGEKGTSIDGIESGQELRVRVRFELNRPLRRPELIIGTHTTDFVYLTAGSTGLLDERLDMAEGVHEVEYTIPSLPFASGTYCIQFAIFDEHGRLIFWGETLKTFIVKEHKELHAYRDKMQQVALRILSIPGKWILDGKAADKRERDEPAGVGSRPLQEEAEPSGALERRRNDPSVGV